MANVIVRDLGLHRFIAQMQVARGAAVIVGLQGGDENEDGESIAEYGAKNEFGTSYIPARPFMRSAFDENSRKLNRSIEKKIKLVQSGALSVYNALRILGEEHQDQIKKKIGSNIQPPNSQQTIDLKGSSRTLIDKGAMINSVRYILKHG